MSLLLLFFLYFNIQNVTAQSRPVIVMDYCTTCNNYNNTGNESGEPRRSHFESHKREIKNEIERNESRRNSYLPSIRARQAENMERLNESIANQTQFLEHIQGVFPDEQIFIAKSEHFKSIRWDAYRLTSFSDKSYELALDNFNKYAIEKNYFDLVSTAESMLYSNSGVEKLPYFTNDGVFLPEKLDQNILPSPLSYQKLQTKKNSAEGQLVRRLTNEYQAYWASNPEMLSGSKQENFFGFLVGTSLLKKADTEFAKEDTDLAQGYITASREVLDFLLGIPTGVVDSLESYTEILPLIGKEFVDYYSACRGQYADLESCYNKTVNLFLKMPEVATAVYEGLKNTYNTVVSGSSYERGQVVGSLVLDTAIAFVGGVGMSGASKAGLLSKFETTTLKSLSASTANSVLEATKLSRNFTAGLSKKSAQEVNEVIHALKHSGKKELVSETEAIVREYNKFSGDKKELVHKVITSQLDEKNGAKYFNAKRDLNRISQSYDMISKELRPIKKENVEGYMARVVPKEVKLTTGEIIENTPDSIMKPHAGIKQASNRFGIGGPNGQPTFSYGFGKTSEEALEVARKEFASYYDTYSVGDPRFVENSVPFKAEKVLVLDEDNLKKIGLKKEDVTIFRSDSPDAYINTNIISHLAKDNSFDAILAPSAEFKKGFNLHIIKE